MLYSPNESRFVFGDFGMVIRVSEGVSEKTLTRFAGTPNFCIQEMARLLGGGVGLVNLYLNDFYSLQKTIGYLYQNMSSQNSRISENSMSFNGYSEEQVSVGNYSEQYGSQNILTDQTYIPTRNSVVTLPTTHTLAPKKYASSINHYQSEIVYEICRAKERVSEVSMDFIDGLIMKKYEQHGNDEILSNLLIQLQQTFHLGEESAIFINQIKEWKNASRHYGPENEFTLRCLEKVIEVADVGAMWQLKEIRRRVLSIEGNFDQSFLQLQYVKNMKNYGYLVYVFMGMLRSLWGEMIRKGRQLTLQIMVIISQQYIFCMRSLLTENKEVKMINRLVHILFKSDARFRKMIQQANEGTVNIVRFCFDFLRRNGKERGIDFVYYLTFLFEYSNHGSWQ